jgi:hypothetical protein
MVLVEPPPEWLEASRKAEEAAAASETSVPAPPPLDHVASTAVSLELEPAQPAWWSTYRWVLLTGVVASALTVAAVWWMIRALPPPTDSSPSPSPPASPSDTPAEPLGPKSETDAPSSVPQAMESSIDSETSGSSQTASAQAENAGGKETPSADEAEQKPSMAVAEGEPPVKTESAAGETPQSPESSPALTTPATPSQEPTVAAGEQPKTNDAATGVGSTGAIRKLAPVAVDVAARLADGIPDLAFSDMPLSRACDLLASISSIPITLDVDAMRQLDVSPSDVVSLHLTDTTVGKALQAIADESRLAVKAEAGHVLITSPASYREALRTVRYTVSDLLDDKETADELAKMIRTFVAPESWQTGGGAVEPDGGALVVVQTGDVHYQVVDFCERLRLARQKPLRSRGNPERFSLTTRTTLAKELLDRPITVNFHEPTPLHQIIAYLAKAAECQLPINRIALDAAETCDRVEGVLVARDTPLGTALHGLLTPLGLTYRVVDAQTLEITTRDAIEERMELEFYPVGPWTAKGTDPATIVERIKTDANGGWGESGGAGQIGFDPLSSRLLVLQSQPVQQAIERLLEKSEP